jgi:ABC-2 type transport system ATP-binding protein
MQMLEVSQLTKTYKNFELGPIDLDLEAGTVHGLIGPNGAGKSTLYRCIMGTVRRDRGRVRIAELDANSQTASWKNKIGYVGDYTPLFDHLSGAVNLTLFSRFYEHWSNDLAGSLANRLGLDLATRAGEYSTGQRTKLSLIIAMAHRPNLLLLDEPTNGLDPIVRATFMEVLYEQMQQEEFAMLYATHPVSEIERLADNLILLNDGKLLRRAAKEDLLENWRRLTFRTDKAPGSIPGQISVVRDGLDYEVLSASANDAIAFLAHAGTANVSATKISLEDICVEILRHGIRN